jgi:hypothetical protein
MGTEACEYDRSPVNSYYIEDFMQLKRNEQDFIYRNFIFFNPLFLQAVQIHSANGVKLLEA